MIKHRIYKCSKLISTDHFKQSNVLYIEGMFLRYMRTLTFVETFEHANTCACFVNVAADIAMKWLKQLCIVRHRFLYTSTSAFMLYPIIGNNLTKEASELLG